MQLVIDVGSQFIKAALFEEDKLLHHAIFIKPEELFASVKNNKIDRCLIGASDQKKGQEVIHGLTTQGMKCQMLESEKFQKLSALRPDTVANIFGALYHFPSNNCIVVDLGTTIRFDYVTKHGTYEGGTTFPSFKTVSPHFEIGSETPHPLKSGFYFGILGAIERIVAELRLLSESPSAVSTVATGGWTFTEAVKRDLGDFIDTVDPHLSLIGLNQILKEMS